MLPNSLEKLGEILKQYEYKFSKEEVAILFDLLDFYKDGIIPMPVIRRKLNLDIDNAWNLLIYLESKGVVKSMYKVYCNIKSEAIREEIYDDIRKVPKKHCDKCEEGCLYIENVGVVFKVVL